MGNMGSSPEYYGKAVGQYEEIEALLTMTYEDMLPEGTVDV